MRSGDWSSDVCSSDLGDIARLCRRDGLWADYPCPLAMAVDCDASTRHPERLDRRIADRQCGDAWLAAGDALCFHGLRLWASRGPTRDPAGDRSEEHTSELQSLMRISYAVFCLKKKKHNR